MDEKIRRKNMFLADQIARPHILSHNIFRHTDDDIINRNNMIFS